MLSHAQVAKRNQVGNVWAVRIEVPKKRTREEVVADINKITGARERANSQIASAMCRPVLVITCWLCVVCIPLAVLHGRRSSAATHLTHTRSYSF